MADYKVHVLIFLANLTSEATSNSLLVEWMPNAATLNLRNTADACVVIQFVNHNWVSNEATATGNLLGNLVRDKATKVASVFAGCVASVFKHFLIYLIHTTRYGLS